MNNIIKITLLLMLNITSNIFAVTDFETRYPASVQTLIQTEMYEGGFPGRVRGRLCCYLK